MFLLTSVMFSLFDFFTLEDGTKEHGPHKMICRCRPWFGSVWSGSERSGSVLHHEFKTTSHI